VQAGASHVQRRGAARRQQAIEGRIKCQLRESGQAAGQDCPVGNDAAVDVLLAGLRGLSSDSQ